MNNDAFKDLVRSKVKSTKQIARDTVEEAFKKKRNKRKGRGRGDDDLSSSDESDTETSSRPKKQSKSDLLQPTSVRNKGQGHVSQYRDRAKERREGTNKDYDASQKLLETVTAQGGEEGETSLNQDEISKYLGGDEAHTHLVKGLDVALARSVKSKMKSKQDGGDADDTDEEEEDVEKKPIHTKEEAWQYIREKSGASNHSHTALGRSMLGFLRQQIKQKEAKSSEDEIAVSAAGAAIQRTRITFSVDWQPGNLALSWEVPSEKSQAAALYASRLPKASPLPADLIRQICQAQKKRTTAVATGDAMETKPSAAAAAESDSEDDIFPDAGE